MAKEKKQFRELSDEELENVTGGRIENIIVNTTSVISKTILSGMLTCSDSMKDEKGNCKP